MGRRIEVITCPLSITVICQHVYQNGPYRHKFILACGQQRTEGRGGVRYISQTVNVLDGQGRDVRDPTEQLEDLFAEKNIHLPWLKRCKNTKKFVRFQEK